MERETLVWLGLLIIFLVIEIITVGLTSIWLAGGALAALLLNIANVGLAWQIAAFFVVSFLLLFFTRPFAVKYINSHHEKTNYESIIGKVVRVTEKIDNLAQTGTAVVGGQEWTARAENDEEVLEPGELVEVVSISGVKLIVSKHKQFGK
ncbi:MAG: NfeD family protein [Muricomes sp.]